LPSVLSMMKTLCSFANRNAEVKSYIAGLESRVSMEIKGEGPFYLEFSNDQVSVHEGVPDQVDATVKSDKETMDQVIAGKLSQEDAYNRKLIETSGSIADAMRVRYVINQTLQKSKTLGLMQKLLGAFR
jgi:putative sterol carrier protein